MRYLLFLQEHLPTLFEQGAEYDVNFITYIEAQNHLVRALRDNPNYMKKAQSKSDLKTIDIYSTQRTSSTKVVLDKESFLKFVNDPDLKVNLGELSSVIENSNLKGLITGLATLYPADIKARIFETKSILEKIAIMRRQPLDPQIFRTRFKAARFGLRPKDSFDDALDLAEDWYRGEKTFAHNAWSECVARLGLETCFDIFSTGDASALGWSSDLTEVFSQVRSGIIDQFGAKLTSENLERTHALKLVEVPPYIGIFRGIAGADCSTSYSFPFVYAPSELTFFVYATNGAMLGYVSATMLGLETQSGKYLYVHTISGPEMSRRHVQLIIHGLNRVAKRLGVAGIVIPNKERIWANVNYVVIQKAMYEFLGKTQFATSYSDEAERVLLAKIPTGVSLVPGYDLPQGNTVASPIRVDQESDKQIDAEINTAAAPKIVPTRRLDRRESVLIALDLLTGERMHTAQETLKNVVNGIAAEQLATGSITYSFRSQVASIILQRSGINFENFALNQELKNEHGLALRDFYNRLEHLLREYDVALDETLMKERPYLFYEGHLRARDAITTTDGKMRKRTVDSVIAMIKRWPDPIIAYNRIYENPEFFQQSNRFQTFIASLVSGDLKDYKKLIKISAQGVRLFELDSGGLAEKVLSRLNDPGLSPDDRYNIIAVARAFNQKISDCDLTLQDPTLVKR